MEILEGPSVDRGLRIIIIMITFRCLRFLGLAFLARISMTIVIIMVDRVSISLDRMIMLLCIEGKDKDMGNHSSSNNNNVRRRSRIWAAARAHMAVAD